MNERQSSKGHQISGEAEFMAYKKKSAFLFETRY